MSFHWAATDRHHKWLRLALLGSAGAFVLALVGLPPVSIHEPTHFLGIMGPSCGLTRAVRLLAQGDLAGAWRYNPGSFALAAAAGLLLARAVVGITSRRWLDVTVQRSRLMWVAVLVPLVSLWVNQQAHVSLVR
jgi:hypothetical protein